MKSSTLKDLVLTFTPPALTNVLVDSADPTIAITTPTEASYINSINKNSKYSHEIKLHTNEGSDGTLEFAKKRVIVKRHKNSSYLNNQKPK